MSDSTIVCQYMEAKPLTVPIAGASAFRGKWWAYADGEWKPRSLTLDLLYDVEDTFSEEQLSEYCRLLKGESYRFSLEEYVVHASLEHKIWAAASVIRKKEHAA